MNTFLQAAARGLCALAFLAVAANEASAQSILTITDHATGETSLFTADDSHFSMVGDGQAVNISVGRNVAGKRLKAPIAWSLRFEAPEGEAFRPGRYNEAGCPFALRLGRSPGMQVTNNNPICRPDTGIDSVWGSFAIRQIAYDSAGEITGIDLLFSQRAGAPDGDLLTGVFRYRTSPLLWAVDSDPGFAWGEISQDFKGDTSLFDLKGTTNGLRYTASVPRDRWIVMIEPPIGQQLRTGVYQTSHSASLKRAGFSILRGLGPQHCSSNGSLNIIEMDVAPGGEVETLYATFEYRCDGSTAALRGTIRYLQ